PVRRLSDLDLDGIDRAAIFPTFGMELRSFQEDELHRACVRAYNAALAEWVERGQGRLDVQALIPLSGLEDALAELDRVIKLGFRGIVFGGWPAGGEKPQSSEDPFWGRCAESGMVINLLRGGQVGDRAAVAPARYARAGAPGVRVAETPVEVRLAAEATIKNIPLSWLILTGVLERFPSLQVALVGCGAGWLRYSGELLDWNFRYAQFLAFTRLPELPSEYLKRQVKATIDRERYVFESADDRGAGQLLWAYHYPTHMSTWPESRAYVEALVGDAHRPRARQLLSENYRELYPART